MEKGTKTENITGLQESGGSKIPKPGKFLAANETRSKTLLEKKTVKSSKTTTKITTKASSNLKQTQVANLPKNVKRMSVAKITKDVMNHFQDENLKSDDHATESAAGIKVLKKENTKIGGKREPLKQKFSQVSQKQSRSLFKNPSVPDLKSCTAFGGMRLTAKRNTCRKFDMFRKMPKELKDSQGVNPPEPCTKELKRTVSATAIASKEIEWSNKGNKEDPSTFTTESSKTPLAVKETTLKKCSAFGSIRFAPKWQSTPLKPDMFENIPKVSRNDKEQYSSDSSTKEVEKIPNSAKEDEIITIDETINIDETITLDGTINLDETLRATTKQTKYVKPATITMKVIGDKIFPAFAGIRLTPKRKSTHPKPEIFERAQEELKHSDQESHPPGTSEKIKISSGSAKAILKTEIQHSHVEMPKQISTQKTRQLAAFGGICFAPKFESTPIRPNMLESIQKKSKPNGLEPHPKGSSTKELKTIPVSTITKIKETQLSDDEKLELVTTQKPESSKNDDEAAKKVVPPAFGGIRFKPRQKNLHNVFEAQKS